LILYIFNQFNTIRRRIMKLKIPLLIVALITISILLHFFFLANRKADMILINANIYTLDNSMYKPDAIIVRENKIFDLGKSEEILSKYKSDKIIDLKGKTVLPGLIDAHAHMFGLGQMLNSLVLVGLNSAGQIVDKVKEKASTITTGEWIYGRGWDQTLWLDKSFPTKDVLDKIAPNNPVILGRIDGHAIWVNQKAIKLANVSRSTKDPEGGKIVRDKDGNPTGVFIDQAVDLIKIAVPLPSDTEVEKCILLSARECIKYGLTEVHDMGLNEQFIRVYKKLVDENKLPLRIYGAIDAPSDTWNEFSSKGPLIGYGNGKLTIRAMKLYADGALGSRGAALLESYSDDPGNRGLTMRGEDEMENLTKQAIEKGFQVCIHAIGDRGNHIVLNVFEKISKDKIISDSRFRIEHAQVVSLDDLPRFKSLSIIPSMQPIHATSDMDWAEVRLGPNRIKGAYAWKSLLNSGSIIPAGSDFPNDIMQPLWGFYAAITRKDKDGKPEDGWYPEQCMTREEALKSYTKWAAYTAFEERLKGTITIGKLADLTILSNDIMTISPNEILTTNVEMTIVDGKVVYSK
jgi:predicted amidohydrolase YtcJ